MSKVVHLDDEAHALAKEHCQNQGLRMSDWVAELIEKAISEIAHQTQQATELVSPVPTHMVHESLRRPALAAVSQPSIPEGKATVSKKRLLPLEHASAVGTDGVSAYTAPPFWEQRSAG